MKLSVFVILLTLFSFIAFAQGPLTEAVKLVEAKKFDEARKLFEDILKKDEKNAEAHYHLGRLLVIHYRDLSDAADHLEEAVDLDDANAEYHWMLGNAYGSKAREANIFSQLSLAGKMKDEFARAVLLNPKEVRYRTSLMGYYVQAPGIAGGSFSKAKEQAGEILKLDAYSGHLAFAQIAAQEKELSVAEQEYKKAIAIDPRKPRAYHQLGYLYLRLNRPDEAIQQFQKYVEFAPEDANSYDSLGDGYLAKGDYDAAIAQYKKALSVNSTFSASLFNLGSCYEKKNLNGEAVQMYRQYLAVDPKGANAEDARERIEKLTDQ